MAKRFLGTFLALSATCALALGGAACSSDAEGLDAIGAGGTGTGGIDATGGTSAGGAGTGGAAACVPVVDDCDLATGLEVECKKRFALGINYAWKNFAGDFGGITAWAQPGISNNTAIDGELAAMRAGGVSVVRWWMFPDFRGDGVTFDENGDPTGLSAGATADIAKALELAAAHDLYLVLTIFSFDNFRPDATNGGILVRSIAPLVTSETRRATLVDNVVRPIAEAVAASPHASRLLGWDVINEPEWAVSPTGSAPTGGEFTPNDELTAVSLADMKALIGETLDVLAEVTPDAKRSVGWAAAKWAWAFSDVTNVDFHQPHIYAWVNDYWPYTSTPAELGYGDKPTVMGEYYLASIPLADSSDATFAEVNQSWLESGYAGAWSWQFNENSADIGLVRNFATEAGCRVGY